MSKKPKNYTAFSIKDKLDKSSSEIKPVSKPNYIDYTKQYQDPRWQRKRLEIMNKDNFQCQITYDREDELCVHHKYYTDGFNLWDYSNDCYITMNKKLHGEMHKEFKEFKEFYDYYSDLFSCTPTDIFILLYRTFQIWQLERSRAIKTSIQLLTAYNIDQNQI